LSSGTSCHSQFLKVVVVGRMGVGNAKEGEALTQSIDQKHLCHEL
jgi:hypothetical protein